MKFYLISLCMFNFAFASFTTLSSQAIEDRQKGEYSWKKESVADFDELLLSWNGKRPDVGNLLFYVRVKTKDWSPWMRYAQWGKDEQLSFSEEHPDSFVKMFQDTLNTEKDVLANGFEVKAVAQAGADLKDLDALYVCTSKIKDFSQDTTPLKVPSVHIQAVKGQSQMILPHPRCKDMCSPTSTSTVVNFLSGKKVVDPLEFAAQVKDMGFDIYGNWALNVAQAGHVLRGKYGCRIERLEGFSALYNLLKKNTPVVVSVKGTLPGAPKPYNSGHLMVVVGYNAEEQKVEVIDSAFEGNTYMSYDLKDFLQAWGTRKNLAYVFFSGIVM